MIVAEQKPLAEIKKMVAPYGKLLILGCGTCVKTCFAGGEDEVATLASELRLSFKLDGKDIQIEEQTVERQCEDEFIHEAAEAAARNDAVLSLACSVGVQDIARRYGNTICLPGLNTTFMGAMESKGFFTEECSGCGNCIIGDFGAICPVTKCAKKLLNGPCGGSREGICEVNPETQCAWQLIIDRLTAIGQLDNLRKIYPAKDWRTDTSGGPRKLLREDLVI
jgi:ferredoxin